jgi:transposase
MIKNKQFQKLVKKIRSNPSELYQSKISRKIDWSAYTKNQIHDILDTLNYIKIEVDKVYTKSFQKKVGRPPKDPGNLAKAILFSELFGFPERKAEGWIKLLGYHMGINEHIDDRVLGKAYNNPKVIEILHKVFLNNVSSNGKNGGDGTGLERSRKENYESTKKKGLYMTSIVDSREIVQAFDISGKQECKIMHHLVLELKKIVDNSNCKELNKTLTLDAGFVDRKLTQLIEECGLTPYIFPKKNLKLASKGSPAWKKMWLKLINETQKWLEEYHVRSHTESFHSSFKRVFGIVRKILDTSTYTQVLCRIIHNNRRKLNYFNMASF